MRKSELTKSDTIKAALWMGVVSIIMSMVITLFMIHYSESEKLVWGIGLPIWGAFVFISGALLKRHYLKRSKVEEKKG